MRALSQRLRLCGWYQKLLEMHRKAFPFTHNVPIANSAAPGTIHLMYDPVQKAEETAKIVCRGELRKYRRFRPARCYGGIATADCVGCCLRCTFCWSWHELARPEAIGKFYTPEQVAARLMAIACKNNFARVRISGHEPCGGKGSARGHDELFLP